MYWQKNKIAKTNKRFSYILIFENPQKSRMRTGLLTSIKLAEWAETHGVRLDFIQPGKPTQNSFVERFNRTYREELLDMYVFSHLSEVRDFTEKWLKEYNEERPMNHLET